MNTIKTLIASSALVLASTFAAQAEDNDLDIGSAIIELNQQKEAEKAEREAKRVAEKEAERRRLAAVQKGNQAVTALCNELINNTVPDLNRFTEPEGVTFRATLTAYNNNDTPLCFIFKNDTQIAFIDRNGDHQYPTFDKLRASIPSADADYVAMLLAKNMPENARENYIAELSGPANE